MIFLEDLTPPSMVDNRGGPRLSPATSMASSSTFSLQTQALLPHHFTRSFFGRVIKLDDMAKEIVEMVEDILGIEIKVAATRKRVGKCKLFNTNLEENHLILISLK